MNEKSRQLVLDLPQRQALGRDDFLVTSSNSAAVELIDQWPNWPTYGAIIVGPPGSGKSHLVEVWRQKTGASLFHASELTIATVPQDETYAIEVNGTFDERAFFHALNLAKAQSRHLLMTAQTVPAEWRLVIPDVLSRLNALPIVSILPPDDALLRGVLVKLFADRQITIDEPMISYILLRMPRSLEAARAIVAQIDQQALIERADVTRPFVARVMIHFISPEFFGSES